MHPMVCCNLLALPVRITGWYLMVIRYQQVPVDGAYWREYRQREPYQGGRLLHTPRRVSCGSRRLPCVAQLSHVQDVLLSVWTGLH